MENNQSPSKKKLISIKEEKLLREVDYDSFIKSSHSPKKPLLLDLEIFPKNRTRRQPSQRVLVSIKPRAPPAIKTIYIAEKSRFCSKKGSDKSGSRLGIGDHPSFTTHYSEDDFDVVNQSADSHGNVSTKSETELTNESSTTNQVESSTTVSKCSQPQTPPQMVYNAKKRSAEKCYIYTQPQLTMNLPKTDAKPEQSKIKTNKIDIATLIYTNTSSDENTVLPSTSTLNKLYKRIDHLERKILRQEMVFRSMNPNVPLSSSDEESKDNIMRATSGTGRPGCSYIEQYSHIPETSAFQRYAQQTAPLSPSKATTLEKEHNSEQYGRDFTTYDGITARGRRQCASVPCKRDDIPKMAAERVHKIRHKLNPVRDYRLMDTVHYLAQGEFAPRDDGIKLTPSREAVLSDIIWEDVCRTHWPNARLGRRVPHPERYSTRCELQRLIDNLLRERVAHVERRRRRHYRIVKLNHRHESCRPVGKTGDIIVASHKNREANDEKDLAISDHNAASAMMSDRRWEDRNARRTPRSHDRFMFPDMRQNRRFKPEDSVPGTSYALPRSPANREATCCYHTSNNIKTDRNIDAQPATSRREGAQNFTSGSSLSTCKQPSKNPRLVVKKETSRRKYQSKEGPDLEHYILLPTLVVRTPSNVKRQKKFNELYHRILNVQLNNAQNSTETSDNIEPQNSKTNLKKDIGFNINITLSNSSQEMNGKR
ncbi:uncharacterized protein LOC114362342 isoform X1 [Ostrinia furnacalis]|uniref:uncharacterized protein LOC114362342 isoform X1 n=1 Tax=Ostrinia furnacalis TaxID=93504 RepID=UPI00103FA534|nr:uncharacterized protein LOC114362342 isoform X1 [Ostrinia furnacalis]